MGVLVFLAHTQVHGNTRSPISPPPSIGGRRVHNITRFYSVYSEGGAWIWWSKGTSDRKSPRPPKNGTWKTVPSWFSLEAQGTDRKRSGNLPYVFKQTAQGINREKDKGARAGIKHSFGSISARSRPFRVAPARSDSHTGSCTRTRTRTRARTRAHNFCTRWSV